MVSAGLISPGEPYVFRPELWFYVSSCYSRQNVYWHWTQTSKHRGLHHVFYVFERIIPVFWCLAALRAVGEPHKIRPELRFLCRLVLLKAEDCLTQHFNDES